MDEKIKEAINNLRAITEIASRTEKMLTEIIQDELEEINFEKTWNEVMKTLKEEMTDLGFNTWIKPLKVKKANENVLILLAPNIYTKDLIKTRLLEEIKRITNEILNKNVEIKVEVENNEWKEKPNAKINSSKIKLKWVKRCFKI